MSTQPPAKPAVAAATGCRSPTTGIERRANLHGRLRDTQACRRPRNSPLNEPKGATKCGAYESEPTSKVGSSNSAHIRRNGNYFISHRLLCLALVATQIFALSQLGGVQCKSIDELPEVNRVNLELGETKLREQQTNATSQAPPTTASLFNRLTSVFYASTTSTPEQQPETTTTTTATTDEQDSEYDSSPGNDDDDAPCCQGDTFGELAAAENLTDRERLVELQSKLRSEVKRRLRGATRGGLELFERLSLSGACSSSLMSLMGSLGELKSFAFKFVDASAKVPSGMMYGLLSDFGDFDQCLSIRSNPAVEFEQEAEEGAYSGKYCLMSLRLNYHLKLRANETVPEGIVPDGVLWDDMVRNYWTGKADKGFQVGMCFPSRCTDDDLDQIFRQVSGGYNMIGELMSCQDRGQLRAQHKADWLQLLILYTFALILVLTLAGSLVDRYFRQALAERRPPGPSCCGELVLLLATTIACFSIIKNWRQFVRPHNGASDATRWDNLTPIEVSSERGDSSEEEQEQLRITSLASTPSNATTRTFCDAHQSGSSLDTKTIGSEQDVEQEQLEVRVRLGWPLESERKNPLGHLAGIRLLVIVWITIGHSFLYPSANNYQYYRSIINMNITRDSVWFAATNFTLGIDTLLYITGLVFVYKLALHGTMVHKPGERHWSLKLDLEGSEILRYLSRRLLRFWPTYLAVIGLAIVVPLVSDGPMWPEMVTRRLGSACRKNWWTNLLLVNNFVDQEDICLPSSWFVSVVMQLFLIGALVMIVGRRYSIQVALIGLSLLLSISIGFSFAFAYYKNVHAPAIRMDESFVLELDNLIFRLYTNLLSNLGPFVVGMAGGFLLLRSKLRHERKLALLASRRTESLPLPAPTMAEKLRGCLSQAVMALVVLAVAVLVLSSVFHQEYTRFWSAVYWSTHRVGWAIVTGYLIHQCATGRWPLLNDFLSLSTFQPLSKLIFIAYLVYPIFIHLHSGLVRDGLHVSIYNMLNIYITRLVMTFTTALLVHLLVELPFCSIEEIYLRGWTRWINRTQPISHPKTLPLLAVVPVIPVDFGARQKQKSGAQSS